MSGFRALDRFRLFNSFSSVAAATAGDAFLFQDLLESLTLDDAATFSRASTAYHEQPSGVHVQCAVNEVRWYGATRVSEGVYTGTGKPLMEPSATNRIIYSSALDNWVAQTQCTVSGTRMTATAGTGNFATGARPASANTFPQAGRYCAWADVDKGNLGAQYFVLSVGALSDGGASVTFDLINGTTNAFTSTGYVSSSMVALDSSTWRCIVVFDINTDLSSIVQMGMSDVSSLHRMIDPDGTEYIDILWAQMEAGDKPTSRILTTGTELTRAADAIDYDDASITTPNLFQAVTTTLSDSATDWIGGVSYANGTDLVADEPLTIDSFTVYEGCASPNLRGEWTTGTSYAACDSVQYAGWVYVAISTHTSGATSEPGVGTAWGEVWVRDGAAPMLFTIETATPAFDFYLPTSASGTYNAVVDWGDGSATSTITAHDDADRHHVYASAGEYQISIKGLWTHIDYYTKEENRTSAALVKSIDQWGKLGQVSLSTAFRGATNLVTANAADGPSSSVTDMTRTFYNCSSMTTLDVSGFDTSRVTSMAYMFQNCSSLTSLDVSGFDTQRVTNMSYMFQNCSNLTSLDVSGFDTSIVTNMLQMFAGCSSLTSLDVSGFDTSIVTNMGYMFNGCSSLTSLDVSGFDTSSVTTIFYMFYNCSSLTSIDVSGFNVEAITAGGSVGFMALAATTTALYDATLIAWSAQTVTSGLVWSFGSSTYTAAPSDAATARGVLTEAPNLWTITDGGEA
jgi:surface protein